MAKSKYTLLAGIHSENGKIYKRGDEVISSSDLVKAFGKEKFVFVAEVQEAAPKAPAVSALGQDCTDDFEDAGDKALKVFKKGANYFVSREAAPDVAIHDKALTLKGVEELIAKTK